MRTFQLPIPSGDGGTYATLGHMARLVRGAIIVPRVRYVAAKIASDASSRDGTAQARAIRAWVEDHTVFLRDPFGVELLHDPAVLVVAILTKGLVHVDCDDVAMLAAALGMAAGLRARFTVVGFDSPKSPFRHVWTDLSDPRGTPRWIEMDVTRPAQGLDGLPISRVAHREI